MREFGVGFLILWIISALTGLVMTGLVIWVLIEAAQWIGRQ